MLRPGIKSFLRRDNRPLLSSLYSNLHTTMISTSKWMRMAKRERSCEALPVAIILSGCGALDGTEISESVSLTIHVCQRGMKPRFFAPDVEICGLVNHYTKEPDKGPPRNALVEAARLARSSIKPISECQACSYGALFIPGGFGAARTLSDFASKGANCVVLPDLQQLIEDFQCEKKPIGTLCIASAIVAKVLTGVKITLGKDSPKEDWPYREAIQVAKKMGATLEMKDVKGVTHCKRHNVFSTPAWMYKPATYSAVHAGIGNLVDLLKRRINR